jgi:hypothetical protein
LIHIADQRRSRFYLRERGDRRQSDEQNGDCRYERTHDFRLPPIMKAGRGAAEKPRKPSRGAKNIPAAVSNALSRKAARRARPAVMTIVGTEPANHV